MQFIANGPDIPDPLLQAHEDGRVVFFCGAGISYPAGLPGFKGLLEQIYEINGTVLSDIELDAFERGQFDAALDLLESRLPGGRFAIRSALAEALKPKLRRKGATKTQEALLRLGRSRHGALRLVTTNFDRVFHSAASRISQKFNPYVAPLLPIPKNSRWDGLVFLHGLLPSTPDATSLNRLVVTSGDFGLAYLTERWAARFVTELFRNYVVCFVGYSINDPVLRYMMDALAADRRLGEMTPQAWAFGDFQAGQEKQKAVEWEAKGVKPILYEVPTAKTDHSALHKTLQVWSETYHDGVLGKERIVLNHALATPSASTQQDDFVGRMLWALSDKSGLPAKQFADFNPVPSLEWLISAFSKERFQHSDLSRFNVPPHEEVDPKLRFSLVRRPAPYDRSPPMLLASGSASETQWDDVMYHLARWLTRHLDDPHLILWIAHRGGRLNERFLLLLEQTLDRIIFLESKGRRSELNEIRSNSPKAIPRPQLRRLWRLLLSGRIKASLHDYNIYRWIDRLKLEGLNTNLRLELRELLAPKVLLKNPLRLIEDEDNDESADDDEEAGSLRQFVDTELVLTADHVYSALEDLSGDHWKSALPQLLEDFQQLLRDALDLLAELGEANYHNDHSHWDLPSIQPHAQNRRFQDWVSIVELLRDSWVELRQIDESRAIGVAYAWFGFPYPTFKRLALFAASQSKVIQPEDWVDWLISDNSWWLWATDTGREVARLLVLQGAQLQGEPQRLLESAILAGPPRDMYRDDLELERWNQIVDRSVWFHLAKLEFANVTLGADAKSRLSELSKTYPHWRLAADERDEFSHWMSVTDDEGFDDHTTLDVAPRKRKELVHWLEKPKPQSTLFHRDTWGEACRKHPLNSLYALDDLARKGVWPASRWREALQVWSEGRLTLRSWQYGADCILALPDPVLIEISNSLTYWMKAISSNELKNEEAMVKLCQRVMALPLEAATGISRNGKEVGQPFFRAINHPIGQVVQALLNVWLRREPNDSDGIPADIEPLLSAVCDLEVERFIYGRVILSSRLITLYRVDQGWTETHMLPLFTWDSCREANALWEGFLSSPRLHQPTLFALKDELLNTAYHYGELYEHGRKYPAFITFAALSRVEGYTLEEFRRAIGALPPSGLEQCAQALHQALEGAGDQREEYWKNRVQPFWQQIWPKSRELATKKIAESLARMVIAAGDEFPAALNLVKDWLHPLENPGYVIHRLHDSQLCKRFPWDALRLLSAVIEDQGWPHRELGFCLDDIARTAPEVATDPEYRRLREYLRRRENR